MISIMRIKIIGAGIIVGLILVGGFFLFKNNQSKEQKKEPTYIESLVEMFPTEDKEYNYIINGETKKVTVKVKKENDYTLVTMIFKEKNNEEELTVNDIFTVYSDKIIEKKEYYNADKLVTTVYPTQILSQMPYQGLTYNSSDNLIIYRITNMLNDQLTIEGISQTIYYDEQNKETIKKHSTKWTFEKGKGLVLYESGIEGIDTGKYTLEMKQKKA